MQNKSNALILQVAREENQYLKKSIKELIKMIIDEDSIIGSDTLLGVSEIILCDLLLIYKHKVDVTKVSNFYNYITESLDRKLLEHDTAIGLVLRNRLLTVDKPIEDTYDDTPTDTLLRDIISRFMIHPYKIYDSKELIRTRKTIFIFLIKMGYGISSK